LAVVGLLTAGLTPVAAQSAAQSQAAQPVAVYRVGSVAIKFVGRRIATTSGLLLLTYRDDDVDPGDGFLRRIVPESVGLLKAGDVGDIGLQPVPAVVVAVEHGRVALGEVVGLGLA